MRETRITAGCEQHNLTFQNFQEGLARTDIMLNRKSLADLAAWEPYSFKALTDIAKQTLKDGLNSVNIKPPAGVITRGMLK